MYLNQFMQIQAKPHMIATIERYLFEGQVSSNAFYMGVKLEAFSLGRPAVLYKVGYEDPQDAVFMFPLRKISEHSWQYNSYDGSVSAVINRGGRITRCEPAGYKHFRAARISHLQPLVYACVFPQTQDGKENARWGIRRWQFESYEKFLLKNRLIVTDAYDPQYCVYGLDLYLDVRTRYRIDYGEYLRVPRKFKAKWGTGVHVSTLDEKLLAFYPTDKHIIQDKPQQIKPGKYLKRYFPDMTDDEIRVMASMVMVSTELKVLEKGQEIIDAYMVLATSGVVKSCMSKLAWRQHPLMVYDNSDVALVVLYEYGEPVARALFNKHNKQYPMVYGQWEKMKHALDKAGYIHGSLDGAKIHAIRHNDGGYVMPYIDGHRRLDRSMNNSTYVRLVDDGKFFIIDHENGVCANEYERARIMYDDEPEADYYTCECCGDEFTESEMRRTSDGDWVCDGCWDEEVRYVRLEGGGEGEYLYRDSFEIIDGEYYWDSAAARYWGYRWSSKREEWIHQDYAIYIVDIDDYDWESNKDRYFKVGYDYFEEEEEATNDCSDTTDAGAVNTTVNEYLQTITLYSGPRPESADAEVATLPIAVVPTTGAVHIVDYTIALAS